MASTQEEYLTEIADQLRELEGTTDKIAAYNFGQEIAFLYPVAGRCLESFSWRYKTEVVKGTMSGGVVSFRAVRKVLGLICVFGSTADQWRYAFFAYLKSGAWWAQYSTSTSYVQGPATGLVKEAANFNFTWAIEPDGIASDNNVSVVVIYE